MTNDRSRGPLSGIPLDSGRSARGPVRHMRSTMALVGILIATSLTTSACGAGGFMMSKAFGTWECSGGSRYYEDVRFQVYVSPDGDWSTDNWFEGRWEIKDGQVRLTDEYGDEMVSLPDRLGKGRHDFEASYRNDYADVDIDVTGPDTVRVKGDVGFDRGTYDCKKVSSKIASDASESSNRLQTFNDVLDDDYDDTWDDGRWMGD